MTAHLIVRPTYLDVLARELNTQEIKVLTGVRRGGKSSILRLYADRLQADGVEPRNMFFKRLDDFDTPLDYSASDLYAQLSAAIRASDERRWFYVFLDEIQDIEGWEDVVRRLHTRKRTDIYITGSNAQVLSGELATMLTGRYREIPIFPLSFTEYQNFIGYRANKVTTLEATLTDYLRFGGMPGIFALNNMDEAEIRSTLSATYDSILFSDVVSRLDLRSSPALERVARFILSTSGNLFSLRNVTNALRDSGVAMDSKTVDALIEGLIESFVIYATEQQGVRGKRVLRPQRKFYPVDTGLRSLATGFGTTDIGARLEGVVYMELRRRGYEVAIGSLPRGEIDFIASLGDERAYIQVTDSMLDVATRERELAPLRGLTDAYPRIVLTADTMVAGVDDDGIRIINVENWLTQSEQTSALNDL